MLLLKTERPSTLTGRSVRLFNLLISSKPLQGDSPGTDDMKVGETA